MKTRPVDPGRSGVYWQKAQRFADAARAAQERKQWDPAVSAAVHAGINAFDAMCVRHLGRRPAGEAHDEALDLLDELRQIPDEVKDSLAKRLRALLAAKNLAEYEDRLCDQREADSAVLQMTRLMDRAEPWVLGTTGPS